MQRFVIGHWSIVICHWKTRRPGQKRILLPAMQCESILLEAIQVILLTGFRCPGYQPAFSRGLADDAARGIASRTATVLAASCAAASSSGSRCRAHVLRRIDICGRQGSGFAELFPAAAGATCRAGLARRGNK